MTPEIDRNALRARERVRAAATTPTPVVHLATDDLRLVLTALDEAGQQLRDARGALAECQEWIDAQVPLNERAGKVIRDLIADNATAYAKGMEDAAEVVRERVYPKNPESDWTEYARTRAFCADDAVAALEAHIVAAAEGGGM